MALYYVETCIISFHRLQNKGKCKIKALLHISRCSEKATWVDMHGTIITSRSTVNSKLCVGGNSLTCPFIVA